MALTQISTKGIKDGTILNADINASAAIAGTKISSDFGSQNIVTNGRLLLGTTTEGHADADDLTIETSSGYAGITLRSPSDAGGAIYFSDATSGAGEYDGQILYSQSSRTMQLITANNPRLTLDSSGNLLSGTTSNSLLSNFNANAGGLILDDIGSGATAFLATHGDKQIFLGNDTSANYLWGYSNHDLLFGTNNQPRMTINSSGNIAIGGSSNVGTKLHIENPSGDAHIRLRGSANYGVLFTRHSDGALTGYVGSGAAVNLGGSDIALSATLSGGSIRFQTNGTAATDEKMRIQNDGKIGIGTTSPEDLLHIKSGKIRIENTIVSNNDSTISYDNTDFLIDVDPNNARGSSKFEVKVDAVTGLTIDDNRRVGIGTTSPSQHLVVSGTGSQYIAVTSTNSSNTGVLFGDSDIDAGFVLYANSDDSLRIGTGGANERMRITSDGNTVFKDKDSGHSGGGVYSRTKTVTLSGDNTTSFMRFSLTHGALAAIVYLTASNGGSSVSRVYAVSCQFADNQVESLAYAGTYGSNGLLLKVSTSTSNHTFQVEVSGGTQEVTMTVHVGNANQDITYTEL